MNDFSETLRTVTAATLLALLVASSYLGGAAALTLLGSA